MVRCMLVLLLAGALGARAAPLSAAPPMSDTAPATATAPATGAGGMVMPTTRPSLPPATMPVAVNPRLLPFIEAIQRSQQPQEAMSAYARGCAVDRRNPRIHDEYMKRMLQFGQPEIAYFAAATLVTLDNQNPTAWGLVGYHQGKKGELLEAFAATMRAVQRAPDDPSILHNAGQLVAWYDSHADPPPAPDSVRRILDNLREELGRREPYAKAYRTIKTAVSSKLDQRDDLEKKLSAADSEYQTARQDAVSLDRELRDLNDQIEYHQRLAHSLLRELAYSDFYSYREMDGRYYYVLPYGRIGREEARDHARQEERTIDELRFKARELRRKGEGVLAELAKKEAAAGELRAQIKLLGAGLERHFRWDPPAVDGVVTAEADRLPPVTRVTDNLPRDPELEAAQRLDLARLYVAHELREKAADVLRDLVARYPKTKAAGEAGEMLKRMAVEK